MSVDAYIGMGSNLGDRLCHLRSALGLLRSRADLGVTRCSRVYQTRAWGLADQPDFLNAVVEVTTSLPPHDLLRVCLDIERALGRVRSVRWGPRTIDLDVLLYGQERISSDDLTVPHPSLERRVFVLAPLAELAPEAMLPSGRSVAQALADLAQDGGQPCGEAALL